MNDQGSITLKTLWLFVNGILLATAGVSWLLGAEDIMNICGVVLMLLSFPCNLLVGWLFFAFGGLAVQPGLLLLMFLSFSWVGYVQWFKLVPKLRKYLSGKFVKHDMDIHVNLSPKQMSEAKNENILAGEWQPTIYDEDSRTPVERVLNERH